MVNRTFSRVYKSHKPHIFKYYALKAFAAQRIGYLVRCASFHLPRIIPQTPATMQAHRAWSLAPLPPRASPAPPASGGTTRYIHPRSTKQAHTGQRCKSGTKQKSAVSLGQAKLNQLASDGLQRIAKEFSPVTKKATLGNRHIPFGDFCRH